MAAAQSAPRAVASLPVPSPRSSLASVRQPTTLAHSALQVVPRTPLSRREAWLLGALAAALHGSVLYWAVQSPPPVLPVVPPQVPPMTLEFSQPAPPVAASPMASPPVAAPAPMEAPTPVEDELAAKPVSKPAPKPKPVVKAPPKAQPEHAKPAPAPISSPAQPAPVAPAPVAAPAPAAPPAPTAVTPPSASAGYLKNPAPAYPALAQRRGWEGTVLLRVHVTASGSPSDIQIQQSAGRQQLDEAAVAAVRRWSFAPARQGSQAVDGWVTVPIDFKIR
ncbi:energy transducer TonB [Pseudomonas sp. DC3200b2]|uniref:energy transducer TonB n=1 Tax=Pseudomonas sp. DC3200b2 TaxID=2804669 RepID=UPI003CE86F92